MENFELYIEPVPVNPVNGRFRKGHKPFNKGVPMVIWMDGRKIRKVKKCLEIGRKFGNKHLPGFNSKRIVGVKDVQIRAFKNSKAAEVILKAEGIKVNRRNINACCHKKLMKVGKYEYIRKRAGGYSWYFENEFK